jgi:hypothetical protein
MPDLLGPRRPSNDILRIEATGRNSHTIYIYIGECNQRRNSTNISSQISPHAIEDLNKQSISRWKKPAFDFINYVGQLVKDEVKVLVTAVFSSYQNTSMYMVILNSIESFLESAFQDQKEEVVKIFRMENDHLLTSQHFRVSEGAPATRTSCPRLSRPHHDACSDGTLERPAPRVSLKVSAFWSRLRIRYSCISSHAMF